MCDQQQKKSIVIVVEQVGSQSNRFPLCPLLASAKQAQPTPNTFELKLFMSCLVCVGVGDVFVCVCVCGVYPICMCLCLSVPVHKSVVKTIASL